MTAAKLRVVFRWIHIIIGLVLLCYVYSPFHEYKAFQIAVKFIAIPIIVLSGLWLWKFKSFNRVFKVQ